MVSDSFDPESAPRSDSEFDRLRTTLRDDLGFAADYYKSDYLRRRVKARMRRVEADTYGEYRSLLSSDAAERTALEDALSVNVTEFFRNEDVWADLLPLLGERLDDRDRLRAWSAACSDGREPYSLAMAVRSDPRLPATTVDVLGTDIDEAALETAREGRYRSSNTTDIEAELSFLSRPRDHVTVEGDRQFTVADEVAERVRFQTHDLIQDDPKSGFDLVLCRNLLIYIQPSYEHSVLETLTESLSPGGLLVIGKTERLPPAFEDRYDTLHNDTRIYRRTED